MRALLIDPHAETVSEVEVGDAATMLATDRHPAASLRVDVLPVVSERVGTAAREVAKLRRLLRVLLHDAPDEVEPEIRRTLRDDALVEALHCYELAHSEYHRAGELPGQPNFRGKKP